MQHFPKHNSSVFQSLRPAITSHLATLVLLLFLCAQIHSVIHQHNDLGDHPDCSICAVAHHQNADHSLPVPFNSPALIISKALSFFSVILITSSAPQTYPSRAPPA
jgi:hypothetical protein